MATRHYRAHQRFQTEITATIRSQQRGVCARGRTVDLGIGGAAFALDTPLRLGEIVQVELGAEHQTHVSGQVTWVGWSESTAVRLGIRFEACDTDQLAVILNALGVAA